MATKVRLWRSKLLRPILYTVLFLYKYKLYILLNAVALLSGLACQPHYKWFLACCYARVVTIELINWLIVSSDVEFSV